MIEQLAIAGKNNESARIKILRGANLEIQNVQAEDAGTYSCFQLFQREREITTLLTSHEIIISGS